MAEQLGMRGSASPEDIKRAEEQFKGYQSNPDIRTKDHAISPEGLSFVREELFNKLTPTQKELYKKCDLLYIGPEIATMVKSADGETQIQGTIEDGKNIDIYLLGNSLDVYVDGKHVADAAKRQELFDTYKDIAIFQTKGSTGTMGHIHRPERRRFIENLADKFLAATPQELAKEDNLKRVSSGGEVWMIKGTLLGHELSLDKSGIESYIDGVILQPERAIPLFEKLRHSNI